MNSERHVVGIELRGSYLVVALAEPGQPLPRAIGDGCRMVIPAALTGDAWGSEAAAKRDSAWHALSAARPLNALLKHVERRLLEFTGYLRLDPLDCQLVLVTTQPRELIGLDAEVEWISPPRAALANWLARQVGQVTREELALVVAIGDRSIEAGGFIVQTGPRPAVVKSTEEAQLVDNGAGFWIHRMIKDVAEMAPGEQALASSLDLWQAAQELGDSLRRSPRSESRWTGPLMEHMVRPAWFSARQVLGWQEVQEFAGWLEGALPRLVERLGRQHADRLIVTGLGACWPWPIQPSERIPAPGISVDPALDIARGACLWPAIKASPAGQATSGRPISADEAVKQRIATGVLDCSAGAPLGAAPSEHDAEFRRLLEKHTSDAIDSP